MSIELPFIDIIAGARPNFMKIAPIIHALEERLKTGGSLKYRLIHTGQHYDQKMSGDFFEQLGIPKPHHNLEAGSGSQAVQTGAIMARYEELMMDKGKPSCCLVVGDVNSTMACAITAQKLHVPVAHVEAGIRSGDWTMPEEINRLATDAITNWFFTTSDNANNNLRKSGIEDARIFFVGNTMIDTLLRNLERLEKPHCWDEHGLEEGNYFVATLHRPANVDDEKGLHNVIETICNNTRDVKIVFPVHPRTKKNLESMGALPANLICVDPQPYLQFIYLVKHAKAVITDSGGITEETTVMGVPCMTMRDNTERPETIDEGTNELVGTNPQALIPYLDKLFAGEWKSGRIPEKWDGKTSQRIVEALEDLLAARKLNENAA